MQNATSFRILQHTARSRILSPRAQPQSLLHRHFHLRSTPATRSWIPAAQNHLASHLRFHSTSPTNEDDSSAAASAPAERPLTDRHAQQQHQPADQAQHDADTIAARKALSPAYQLWITCKKCLERSSHTISKQAYHFGSCVVQCPKCKSQHLISDNLKIFSDTNITMEDIAKEHGEKLRKGRLGADGDIEFYDDDATAKIAAKS